MLTLYLSVQVLDQGDTKGPAILRPIRKAALDTDKEPSEEQQSLSKCLMQVGLLQTSHLRKKMIAVICSDLEVLFTQHVT